MSRRSRKSLRLDDVVGVSAALAAVLREVELVAPLDVAVLITGETGTRQDAACARDPRERPAARASVRGAQLLGHPGEPRRERAVRRDAAGRIRAPRDASKARSRRPSAGRCSSTKSASSRWARRPSSSSSCTPRSTSRSARRRRSRADVRIIAATNRDLRSAFASGVSAATSSIDCRSSASACRAWSERREDIPLLAEHLCAARAAIAHGLPRCCRCRPRPCGPSRSSEWRGNIRELAHAIEAAAIRAAGESGEVHRGDARLSRRRRRRRAGAAALR